MVDPVQGGMAFQGPDDSKDLALRNVKHAADKLSASLSEAKLAIQNRNPSQLADEFVTCENSLNIMDKYAEVLGSDLKEKTQAIQKTLEAIKRRCNAGEQDSSQIENLQDQVRDLVSKLENF